MKRTLYLVAGANGSGKTTLAHELLNEEKNLVFLNVDEIAASIGDTVGLVSGKILLNQINDVLRTKKSFVLESTISGKYHERVIMQFRREGYQIFFVYVFLESVEQNLSRIRQRVLLGGHNVPELDVRRRFSRSINNFHTVANLADKWELYYNGGNNYEIIARGKGKLIEVIDDSTYNKFIKVTIK